MARVRDTEFSIYATDTAAPDAIMPTHAEGDVLVVFACKDHTAGNDSITATSGWIRGSVANSAGSTTAATRSAWFVKRATSSAEVPCTITNSDPDTWTIISLAIEGAGPGRSITNGSRSGGSITFTSSGHDYVAGNIVNVSGCSPAGYNGTWYVATSNPGGGTFTVVAADPGAWSSGGTVYCLIDAYSANNQNDATGPPYSAVGCTTNFANSMVLYAAMSSVGAPVHYPGLMGIPACNVDDAGTEAVGVAYTVKASPGATGNKDFYGDGLNQAYSTFSVAVRTDPSGRHAAYWDTDWASLITPFRGNTAIMTSDVILTAVTNFPSAGKSAVDYCVQVDASGGPGYVSYTTEANESTDADVIPFPATEASGAEGTGDYFAIGSAKPFNCLLFDTTGCTQGTVGVMAWEYWNGAAWTALASVTDGTTSFTAALADGIQVRWAMPARFNWAKRTISSSGSLYFVRARCTTVWTVNPTISQVYIGGAGYLFDASAAVTDVGVIQYENAFNITPAASAAQGGACGIQLGTTVTLTNKVICGTWEFALPRDYVDSARLKEGGGVHLMLTDSSYNRKTWVIGNYLDTETSDAQRNRYAIDWEQTVDTTRGRTTTDPTDTLANIVIGGLAPRGASSLTFSHCIAAEPTNCVVNGGTSTYPIDVDDFIAMGDASPVQLFRDYRLMIPVTIGGSDGVYIDLHDFTFTFPGVATPFDDFYNASPRTQAHYDTGVLGFIINAEAGDVVKLRDGKISSDSVWRFEMASGCSASATYDFSGLQLINATVTLRDVISYFSGMDLVTCTVTTNGVGIRDSDFLNTPVTVPEPADAAQIQDCTFTRTTGTQHGIIIGGTAASINLTGVTFTGFAGTDGSSGNEAIYVNIGTGNMTITIQGGGPTPSIRTAGATVTVVAGAVNALVACKDVDGANVASARVLLKASDGTGPFPYNTTVTITNTGTSANVHHTSHGMATNDKVLIDGASHYQNRGVFTLTKIDNNNYNVTLPGAPGSDPTGTIKATFVAIEGLSNSIGQIAMTRVFPSDQPVTGWARKSSGSPYYKTSPLTGTIDSETGFSATAIMISDE